MTPNIKKKYFHTNYVDLNGVVNELMEYVCDNDVSHIFICDIMFANHLWLLESIYKLNKRVVYIDHHKYPDHFFDDFSGVIWDDSKSSSMLCSDVFKSRGINSNLDKLTDIVDVFSMWDKHHELFKVSQKINEYYIQETKHSTPELFMNALECNNWCLADNFRESVQKIDESFNEYLRVTDVSSVVQRSGDVSICFGDDWFTRLMIDEMKNGANLVVGVTSWGLVQIRINSDTHFSIDQYEFFHHGVSPLEHIGQNNVITYRLPKHPTLKTMIDEVNDIVRIFQETKDYHENQH